MANFTETTNYSFKKPTVGADTDQWGTHLNETIDGVDSQLKTLADSITSQQLEQLGNVVNVTPVDDQFLRYNGTNWTAETVSIPDVLNDLSNVSGAPSSGDVLTYDGSAWSPASVTSAAVTDGSVTNAKLHPSLQTVIGRILVTDDDDSPTDNQILVYSTSDAEWQYANQAGSTLQTLTDVSTTGLSDGDLMKYDGTAGEFVFIDASAARTLLNVDVSGTDNSTAVSLNTSSHDYLALSSQQITLGPIVLTDDVSGTLPITNGGTSATTAAGARTALGLSIGTNIQAFDAGLESISGLTTAADKMLYTTASDTYAVTDLTAAGRAILDDADASAQRTTLGLGTLATQSTITESQISDLQSYITASSTDTLTNKSGNISQFTNDAGYLTAETNDLSNVSGTLAIANGGTGSSTAATARVALLPALATNGSKLVAVNSGATDIEYIATSTLSITESQISDFGSYQPIDAGLTSIAGLTTAADKMLYATASDTYAVTDLTTAGRALLDDADAAAQRTTLGLGTAATTASTDYATSAQGSTADSALQDVVDDATPQLGGSLDVNGQSIVSVSAGNIAITPDTTGKIILDGLSWPTADGSADQVLKTDGSGNLSFVDQSGGGGSGSSYIEHSSTVSDSLAISSGTNRMYIGNTTFSGSGTMAGYLVISHGYANFTSASALNVTGTLNVVG